MNNTKLIVPYIDKDEYINSFSKDTIFICRNSLLNLQRKFFLPKYLGIVDISMEKINYIKENFRGICFDYDIFNFDNVEFTISGYDNIISDIEKIITNGFTHIMVSNPFIIEILCNNYKDSINIIVSPQLEVNNYRSKLFFEVLNDISSISHVILSNNTLNENKVNMIMESFREYDIDIVIEIDRFSSDNLIIHEHYYNVLFGYYNSNIEEYLKNYLIKNRKYCKDIKSNFYNIPNLWYKVGGCNLNNHYSINNIKSFKANKLDDMFIMDYKLF